MALLYILYRLLVPLIQNPSTPASAYLGVGACYDINNEISSPSSAVNSVEAICPTSWGPEERAVCAAATEVVRRLLWLFRAEVCRYLEGLCNRGLWPTKDCEALYLHSQAAGSATAVL